MAQKIIIGVDEAGRGPLAGPVTVAAVMVPTISNFKFQISKFLRGIKDSKKLSAHQREEWMRQIKNQKLKTKNLDFATSSVGAQIIDKIGITRAVRMAVGRCLKKLKIKNQKPKLQISTYKLSTINHKLFLDGSLYAPRTYLNQETIIKGDEKIPLIAAASIVAKVHRDKKMAKLSERLPQYGFAIHKGYGTLLHRKAIKKYGLSKFHRKTFCTKFA